MKKTLAALSLILLGACAPLNPPAEDPQPIRITLKEESPPPATEKRMKSADASTLAAAKAYAKQGDTATLKEAKEYTDNRIATLKVTAAPASQPVVVPAPVPVPTPSLGTRTFTMSYEVAKLKVGTGIGDYQAVRVMPFNARISKGTVSESSWASGTGGGTDVVFRVTRVSDGKQFMALSASPSAPGTYLPVVIEEVTLRAGEQIAIDQVTGSGATITNFIISLYFTKN